MITSLRFLSFLRLLVSMLFGGSLSFITLSNQTWANTVEFDLNQLDATQQQRQQQQLDAQAKQNQEQTDIRLDTRAEGLLTLPVSVSSCFPISEILLQDYLSDSTSLDAQATPSSNPPSTSAFNWAFKSASKSLNLSLPYCFGSEGIGVLMKQIQNHLIEKGYVTTRVVAPEQDLTTGQLRLVVIPGKIRRTIVEDGSRFSRFTRLSAFTGLTWSSGDWLNIRDIEQSLENLKRIPSSDANIEIVPSEDSGAIGESDLKIHYSQGFPFRFQLGVDDSGSRSTGKYQASATLFADHLFTANDLFYTSVTQSLRSGEDEEGKRGSQSWSFHYSVPYGHWLLSVSQSYQRYHQEIFGAFGVSYRYSGKSENSKLSLSYLLYRDNANKTTLTTSFWSRQSHNYIDQAEVEVQKRRMAGWEASLNHKVYLGDATLELSAEYKRGTAARGALSAPEELWNEGTSRPKIIAASVSVTKPFQLGKQTLHFQSGWNAQWNKTRLIAQDRFSIGGRHTVRGFDGELSLSGERGGLWRNELAWALPSFGSQFYLALDAGRVSGWSAQPQPGKVLVGSALGFRGGYKGLNYDLFVGKPLRQPSGFKAGKVAGFQLSYAL